MSRLGVALVLVAGSAAICWGEDSDRTRYYFGFRFGESAPFSNAHDVSGFSLGVNLGKHVGVELSGDFYELFVDQSAFGDIGELGVLALVPQLRLRYPLFNDRLTPYLIGGAGLALTQFNDVKAPGYGLSIETDTAALIGTVGAGVEYFVADNIALGVEGKFLISGPHGLTVEGFDQSMTLNTGIATVALRLFYPELRPRPLAGPDAPSGTRVYLGLRIGGAIPTHDQVFTGVEAQSEAPAYGGTLNQLFGASLGANFGRHAGLELSIEGYEMELAPEGFGGVGEYAVNAILLQPRFRYPLLDGRLEPYVLGGAGVTFAEFNDKTPEGADLNIKAKDFSVAGAVGAGVDYFVTSNIAFGFETKYLISRGNTLQINNGPVLSGNLDSVFLSFGLRIFLIEL